MKASLGIRSILTGVVGLGLTCLLLPNTAMAMSGQCAKCHTMHNSQDGDTVSLSTGNKLLKFGTCIGCHTGNNTGGTGIVPYVMDADSDPSSDDSYLAGGNFYWVAQSGADADRRGHNVASVKSGKDANINSFTPPGFDDSATFTWTTQLKCAGQWGCHGNRGDTTGNNFSAMTGSHHGNATNALTTADTVGNSFRFLDGIKGYEDSHYEYLPTVSDTVHNVYYGADRTDETDSDTATISSLCAQCHGQFHDTSGSPVGNLTNEATFKGPWVRHPTDFDMNDATGSSEYGSYGYGGVKHKYNPTAPLGNTVVTSINGTVLSGDDDAIVLCISCHRAHGSPYDDLLRWSYQEMTIDHVSGVSGDGCFICHTTKDAN